MPLHYGVVLAIRLSTRGRWQAGGFPAHRWQ